MRAPILPLPELADAATHDRYWNAAMREMRHTGYMHNDMRMYWGKKILEWTESPEQAFDIALRLNNRYFLDGRDANSYCGVAWCFGLHDRAWAERPVFGKVRYMSAGGVGAEGGPRGVRREGGSVGGGGGGALRADRAMLGVAREAAARSSASSSRSTRDPSPRSDGPACHASA